MVNFSTTTLPGNTVISAIAPGFPPATLKMTTENVGGIPTGLQIFLSPSQIPPDKKFNSTVIVEVVDSAGNPVTLGAPLNVTLSSSNSQIGSVNSSLVIQSGQTFGTASFLPTYIAGSTTITASAGNYTTGFGVMTTIGPVARRLVLTAAPSVLPAVNGSTATIAVQLQDNNSQTPALAPSPVSVVFTSSNISVVSVPSPIITIPAGSSYANITVQYGGSCNAASAPDSTANITASAQGYVKGSVIVTCSPASPSPNTLVEYFAPNTLLPNNAIYQNVVVAQLWYFPPSGSDLQPAPAITNSTITVYARSSDNATMQVITVPQNITAGESQASFNVSSTYLPGLASITVQASNLASSTSSLLSFGGAPTSLSLQFAPKTLLSNGQTYNTVILGLVDGSNNPAKAPVNTPVKLVSTIPSVGQIESSVVIPAGQTYTFATFKTSGVAGSTLIAATTSNYTSTNATLNLVTKAATNLGLTTSPQIVLANGQTYQNIIIQLQDSFGDPEKTDSSVTVQLASQNSTVGSVSPLIVIPPGSTFAHVTINSTFVAGSTSIAAFATGFNSGQTIFTSTLFPLSVEGFALSPFLKPGGRTNVTLTVTSNGIPVSGANVNWTVRSGSLANMINSTDANGTASALFTASAVPGAAFITMNVSKSGYASSLELASVRVIPVNSTTSAPKGVAGIIDERILFLPIWSLIVVAVVAVVAVLFVVRRRSGPRDYEIDEEE